jgi:Family of unknown function (DUF5691)
MELFLITALRGTDKSKIPAQTVAQLLDLGVDTAQSDAKVVLEGAAVLSLLKKGARPLLSFDSHTKQSTRGEALPLPVYEILGECNPAESTILNRMLSGRFEPLLPEFLVGCQKKNLRIAPELIPHLLELVKADDPMIGLLKETIGQTGHWLIEQNPKWLKKFVDPTIEDWEFGSPENRFRYFKFIRKSNPNQARDLLESVWTKERAEHRSALLVFMEEGLSIADLPFLQSVQETDKSKTVKELAANLMTLCQLASEEKPVNTEFSTLYQRLDKLFTFLYKLNPLSDDKPILMELATISKDKNKEIDWNPKLTVLVNNVLLHLLGKHKFDFTYYQVDQVLTYYQSSGGADWDNVYMKTEILFGHFRNLAYFAHPSTIGVLMSAFNDETFAIPQLREILLFRNSF